MEQNQLNWIANFIWGIADDVLPLLEDGGIEVVGRKGYKCTDGLRGKFTGRSRRSRV